MASVENIREMNSGSTGIEVSDNAVTEPSQPIPETERVETPPKLAPAPVPESNPWGRQVKGQPLEAFNPQNVVNAANFPAAQKASSPNSSGPIGANGPSGTHGSNGSSGSSGSSGSNANGPNGGSRRPKQRKPRAQKTPEPPAEKQSSPSQVSPNYKRGGPRRKFFQQPAQTPYDMALSLLVQQFDYYFSIDNLLKDIFLRKQMNSSGFIPIQVISDFNRVRVLSNGDINLVTEALNWCPATEVQGGKVRLQEGWERWVFPVEERDPAGLDSDDEETPKFHIDKAVPFVPKANK